MKCLFFHIFSWRSTLLGIVVSAPLVFSDIKIGFPSEEYASIVKQVLEVDPELSPEKVDRTYEVSGKTLVVSEFVVSPELQAF